MTRKKETNIKKISCFKVLVIILFRGLNFDLKLDFFRCKILQFLVINTLDPDSAQSQVNYACIANSKACDFVLTWFCSRLPGLVSCPGTSPR
jgi:hypothetical protein